MADLYQEITEWSGGAQAAGPADRIPLNSTPRAINTAFRNIGSGVANLGVRPGLVAVASSAFSGSPAVIFQRLYSYNNSGAFVNYLVTLSSDGTLRYKNPDDTYTSSLVPPTDFPVPSSLCFTAAANLVDATVMGNRLFLVNSANERRSLLNQTYKPWGLVAPASWTAAGAASGVNSMPDETFDISVASFDDTTGGESALSASVAVAIGGANRRIKVDITPTAAETAQYPYWGVFLRRQTTQAEQYRVPTLYDAGGSIIVTTGQIPIATTSVYVDLSAAQIANLTTTGFLLGAGDPPASDIRFVAAYGRRIVTASQSNIYWSQIDKPDNFDALDFEPIDTGEGDRITGLAVFSDELLLITTTTAIWGLFGNDPQNWSLRPIDHTIGCESHLSIVEFDGKLAWWSATDGPVIYDGQAIQRIGLDNLGKEIVVNGVEPDRLPYITAGQDYRDSRVVWSVPRRGATTRNSFLIPYNYRVKQFEATEWSPMDICSLSSGYAADGTQRLYAGGYGGQVFYFNSMVQNDGVLDGTTNTFEFTPATQSITTIDGTDFDTTGAGLAERYVVITDSSMRPITKVRIASNTSTVLTLSATLTGLAAGSTYTAFIGSPDMRLYTKWMDLDQTFIRKRFDRVYLQVNAVGATSDLRLTTQVNFVDESRPAQSVIGISGTRWDTAVWDNSTWGGTGLLKKRLPILRTGQGIRVVLFHFTPNQDIIIHTIGVLARAQSDRYYA